MSRHIRAQTTPTHASEFHLYTVAMTSHAKDKGVQLPQQVTDESLLSYAVKESRSERVGLYRNEQGGFACLALLKITLSLHQCQRSHHRYNVYRGGTNTGKHRGNTINAMHNMMHAMTWQYAVIWANASSYDLNEVGLNTWFKFQLHIWLFKCPSFVLSKTEDKHCSNMHENGIDGFLEIFLIIFHIYII